VRLICILLVSAFFLALIAQPATTQASHYTRVEVLLDGLAKPAVKAMDQQGRLYFTTREGEAYTLWRYDLRSGELEKVASSSRYIPVVYVNQRGEVYYVAGGLYVPNEIHVVSADLSVDKCVYRTGEGFFIGDADLDVRRNILYFSVVSYEVEGVPPSEPKSKLLSLSRRMVETLVEEVDGWITSVAVSPAHGVFFVARLRDSCVIYRYVPQRSGVPRRGQLRIVVERPAVNFAYFMYIMLGKDGSLYWVYRERAPFGSQSPWGYLEVARLRSLNLVRGGEPEVLYAARFDDRSVFGWIPTHAFSDVSSTGDVFFAVVFVFYDETEDFIYSDRLCWLNSRTGDLTYLFTDVVYLAHFTGFEFFHFTIDSQGNLYVSLTKSGKIVKVYRQ